jgi:hypothetical protein
MENITVVKADVLAILQKNRDAHRALFLEACEGFKERTIEELERRMADVKAGRPIDMFIKLAQPVDQTKDYDRAIKMLSMAVDDRVVLSETDFAQYVMDDWSWMAAATTTNTLYSGYKRK